MRAVTAGSERTNARHSITTGLTLRGPRRVRHHLPRECSSTCCSTWTASKPAWLTIGATTDRRRMYMRPQMTPSSPTAMATSKPWGSVQQPEREAEERESDVRPAQVLEAMQNERALQFLTHAAGEHDDDDEDAGLERGIHVGLVGILRHVVQAGEGDAQQRHHATTSTQRAGARSRPRPNLAADRADRPGTRRWEGSPLISRKTRIRMATSAVSRRADSAKNWSEIWELSSVSSEPSVPMGVPRQEEPHENEQLGRNPAHQEDLEAPRTTMAPGDRVRRVREAPWRRLERGIRHIHA